MSNSRRHWIQQMSTLFAPNPNFRYRLDTKWSQADPAKYPVNDCHEMVQVTDGRLFLLTNHAQNNVLVYETSGKLVDAWTLNLKGAHGLTYHADHLYLTDTGTGRVLKTTLAGRIELELPKPVDVGDYSPTETAIGPTGDIYVADGYGSQYIFRYDKTGQFLSKFGGRSLQPINKGKFAQAHGVALDTRGPEPLIVCTERIRNEFHWFTLTGEHVRTVYLPGAFVSRPVISGQYLYSGVCFGMFAEDYRMWQGRGFVLILDQTDRVVAAPGAEPPVYKDGRLQLLLQAQPALFKNVHDVCVDREQNLYVCQWNSGKVYPYKLHREG